MQTVEHPPYGIPIASLCDYCQQALAVQREKGYLPFFCEGCSKLYWGMQFAFRPPWDILGFMERYESPPIVEHVERPGTSIIREALPGEDRSGKLTVEGMQATLDMFQKKVPFADIADDVIRYSVKVSRRSMDGASSVVIKRMPTESAEYLFAEQKHTPELPDLKCKECGRASGAKIDGKGLRLNGFYVARAVFPCQHCSRNVRHWDAKG